MLPGAATFTVYPNPATGNKINLQIENQPVGMYQVKLINIAGQVIYTNRVSVNSNSFSLTINPGKEMPKGIYHLQLTSAGNDIQLKRVVVQ
jgi:hypothetical protein